MWDVCLCLGCLGVCGVMYRCVVSLEILYVDGRFGVSVYCAGRIHMHLRCTQCSIIGCCFLPYIYLSVADIENPDLFACSCRTWISLDIARFYGEKWQPSNGSAWPACPKNVNRAPNNPHCWVRRHKVYSGVSAHCDSSTTSRLCCLEKQSLSNQRMYPTT